MLEEHTLCLLEMNNGGRESTEMGMQNYDPYLPFVSITKKIILTKS